MTFFFSPIAVFYRLTASSSSKQVWQAYSEVWVYNTYTFMLKTNWKTISFWKKVYILNVNGILQICHMFSRLPVKTAQTKTASDKNVLTAGL